MRNLDQVAREELGDECDYEKEAVNQVISVFQYSSIKVFHA